jgi:protein-L-isoaspartate(D-aspartate) O-methyltransferase
MNQQQQLSTELTPLDRMIQQQIVERGITAERVVEAMRSTPRELFFPLEQRSAAFRDQAAPIGHGQTISQPYIVALMTARLDVHPEHRVLEIGTGSGYQTAILAKLAAEVYTVERLKPLLDSAWERLMELGHRNVHFLYGDGTLGWPQAAPFDRILIAAGAPQMPEKLLVEQLKDGGVAVLPVGQDDEQMLVQVVRVGSRLERTDLCPCRFVKLIGQGGWAES